MNSTTKVATIAGRQMKLFKTPSGMWVSDQKLIDLCARREAAGMRGEVYRDEAEQAVISDRVVRNKRRQAGKQRYESGNAFGSRGK